MADYTNNKAWVSPLLSTLVTSQRMFHVHRIVEENEGISLVTVRSTICHARGIKKPKRPRPYTYTYKCHMTLSQIQKMMCSGERKGACACELWKHES
jgi:hypothetical protein